MPVTFSGPVPVFVMVRFRVNVLFTVALPNVRFPESEMMRPGAIKNVSAALPVPPMFVAVMFAVKLPAIVGVPEIRPVVAFRLRPAGSAVALPKLVGLLVAVIW